MITFDNEHMELFMHADGKKFRVTAICATEKEANDYCEANPDEGVIAVDMQQARIYIAEDNETRKREGVIGS